MLPLASWGARNLLELRVITTYVLRSEADALNFKDDFAADLKEFWEAMKDSSEFAHKKLVAEMRVFAESQSEPLKSAFLDKARGDGKEWSGSIRAGWRRWRPTGS